MAPPSDLTGFEISRPPTYNFVEDVVDRWASTNPSLVALHWVSETMDRERQFTYSHFSKQSVRSAALLANLGCKRGDRMLVVLNRIPEWWEVVCGAIRLGVVVCPCTSMLAPKDIEYRIRVSGANLFVGDHGSISKLQSLKAGDLVLPKVLQVEGCSLPSTISYSERMAALGTNVELSVERTRSEDPCIIYFTSGTTGLPKMVVHSHISYPHAHLMTGKFWLGLSQGELYWNLSELGWAKAAWAFYGAWNVGATLFVHDDRGSFNPSRMVKILNRYPIKLLCAPPSAYRQLVTSKYQAELQERPPLALRDAIGAGEPLNGGVIQTWAQMTGGIQIRDGYGQSETIVVCGNFPGVPIKPGSMGKPLPGVHLRAIRDDGEECSVDEEGQLAIAVAGHGSGFFGIFQGYMDDKGTITRPTKSGRDGRVWYLTGDRATMDHDGYFWFVGRSDDIINSAGYRIGPFEVESTLKAHPAVVESAVVASPDPARVEVVKAFIVLTPEYAEHPNKAQLAAEIQAFCKESAAPYKYPRRIQFVAADFLPKTISGKIKRKDLREMERRLYEAKL